MGDDQYPKSDFYSRSFQITRESGIRDNRNNKTIKERKKREKEATAANRSGKITSPSILSLPLLAFLLPPPSPLLSCLLSTPSLPLLSNYHFIAVLITLKLWILGQDPARCLAFARRGVITAVNAGSGEAGTRDLRGSGRGELARRLTGVWRFR